MCRKFVFLLSFVLVFSLTESVFAFTWEYAYVWDSNSYQDGRWDRNYNAGPPPLYNWKRARAGFSPPPPAPSSPPETVQPPATDYAEDIWLGFLGNFLMGAPMGSSKNVRNLPLTIPAGSDVNLAAVASAAGYQTVRGPFWGLKLDIHGRLSFKWAIAPEQVQAGLVDLSDPCDLVPPEDPNRSVINMYDGSEIYGPYDGRCAHICLGLSWWFASPYATINMYGNSVIYTQNLLMGGHLNMHGGTFDMLSTGYINMGTRDTWVVPDRLISIDIEEGKLILPGFYDAVAVQEWIGRGIVKAYGGAGTIVIDTIINPGRTTVTAIPGPGLIASLPKPYSGATGVPATGVPADVVLKWRPGQYADTHDVYLGTDEDDVNDANKTNQLGVLVSEEQEANTYDPCGLLELELDTPYYWRIDEVNDACAPGLWKGNVWRFTTAPYRPYVVIEDFNSYVSDANLYVVWKDYWTNWTRAEVWLEADPNHTPPGDSMKYRYSNAYDPYYAEAYAATTDPCALPSGIGSNWAAEGVKSLSLWFYGQAGNDAKEKMYVALTDGDSPANTTTVLYGDMNDIKVPVWHEWNIDLAAFADVNLADVTRITIGFGDGIKPTGSGEGTVYFDDIRVYGPRCFLSLKPDGDFTGDCRVDVDDLQRMAEIWLGQLPTLPQPVINLDASGLGAGPLSTWNNTGTAGGSFKDFNSANPADNPTVATVDGVKAVVFDGNDILVATFRAPASITGKNPFTVIYKVRNPGIGVEEWVLMWAKRGTTARYAGVGYGTSAGWGAVAHWNAPDMGFDRDRGVPAANTWHTIAVTYPGGPNSVETVLVDGFVNATEIKTLDIFPDCNVTVGAAYDGNSNDPDFVLTPIFNLSGAVASVKVYSVAIPPGDLAILMGTPIDLKKDDVINFKDYAVMANQWLEDQIWP